jgi:hypothetical protein
LHQGQAYAKLKLGNSDMNSLEQLKTKLRVGAVYRRSDLEQWSSSVDRHLQQLQREGLLKKLSGGLYYYPKQTAFGAAPADDTAIVSAFLGDNRFLLTSPNLYNALGIGTTQLYNETVVYNHKRHGRFKLGGRTFRFAVKPHFPQKSTPEFLVVDLLNNINLLPEDTDQLLVRLKDKVRAMGVGSVEKAVQEFGNARTRKLFVNILRELKDRDVY